MNTDSLRQLLNPGSIAVVGASRQRGKVGNIILRNLAATFAGALYAVNSSGEQVEGSASYRALAAIEGEVDLLVVVVPRDAVPGVMQEAAAKHVGAAVIISSGFREVDTHGAELEEQTRRIAAAAGIRFLGPNTFGLITPSFNATFASPEVTRGKVALVAQSGGLGAYMLEWAQRSGTGISYFVSLGNQADVTEAEILDFLADDAETGVTFVYLESVRDGQRFLDLVPRAAKNKPVIFLKGGQGAKGSEAARTHTGSLAGSADVFRAAVNVVGGMLVENLEDSLNLARLVTCEEIIKPELLVVTNSGGHGVITADEIERHPALGLVSLPEVTKVSIARVLPPQIRPANPLDLSGDATADRYRLVMGELQRLECTKLVLVQALPLLTCVEVANVVRAFKGKSVVGVVMGTDEDAAARILDSEGIPSFRFPEQAVRAIGHLATRPMPRTKVRSPQPILEAGKLVSEKQVLMGSEGLRLMEIYGIRVPRYDIAADADAAVRSAEEIGYPVVMKILPEEPVHKTELKGVVVDVMEGRQVREVFSTLSKMTPNVLIQKQVAGLEVFLGGLDDRTFGQTVLASVGGIYVEAIGRPSHRLAPITEDEALEMLRESRIYDMLHSRKRGYDQDALVRTMLRLSRMTVDLQIEEIDLNPVIVNADGAFAVDVRIILKRPQ